jgi:MFS transporter, SP family, arabinose:H+ symporter
MEMDMQKLWKWSLIVSLGGLLFGFDTAVISGAEQAIQQQWDLSDTLVGQMVAMALYGTVIGALFAGKPADVIGRKNSLIGIAFLYLISAVGSALAPEIYSLMVFRFIGGIGVGASSVVAPMYIAEIAPASSRGRMTAMFQFNLVLGILLAYVSNYLIGNVAEESWRMMLGVEVLPALLFCGLIFTVPRSPRWLLVQKGDEAAALAVLQRIHPENAMRELEDIKNSRHSKHAGLKEFFSGAYNRPILLAFLFALFNQISGINAVIYYAPRIFEMAGLEESAALLSSAGIGLINLIFTILGLAMIDRYGRRFLMYIGSVGYIISLSMVSMVFWNDANGGAGVSIWLFMFIASHAIGQGAVIWVFISEVFPNQVRAYGQSLGCGTHWVMAAIIAGVFPYMAGAMGAGPIFALFAACMVLQLIFVWKMMPETRGLSLESLEKQVGA